MSDKCEECDGLGWVTCLSGDIGMCRECLGTGCVQFCGHPLSDVIHTDKNIAICRICAELEKQDEEK